MTNRKIEALRKLRRAPAGEPLERTVAGRQLVVVNRALVEAGLRRARPYALISIADPEHGPAELPADPLRAAVLRLVFHDTKRTPRDPDLPAGVVPMTAAQADEVRFFVERHPSLDLVLHCHQGLSRSPAVAAAIALGLGGSPEPWFALRVPNRAVFERVLAAWSDT